MLDKSFKVKNSRTIKVLMYPEDLDAIKKLSEIFNTNSASQVVRICVRKCLHDYMNGEIFDERLAYPFYQKAINLLNTRIKLYEKEG